MLSRLYYAMKLKIDNLADRVIHRSEIILENSAHIRNTTLRQVIRTTAITTANICKFIQQFPRLDAAKVVGSMGSVICVGEKDEFTVGVLETLFPEGYEETDLGRIPLWNLSNLTQDWLKDVDLVVYRVSQFFPWRIPAAYSFSCPLRVWQVLPLDKPIEELLAGSNSSKRSLRTKVNRTLKQNFTYKISHSPKDLDRFYHQMLVPTTQQRHQHRAIIEPYSYYEEMFKSSFLMFLSLDGEEVAATLCSAKNGVFHYKCIGNPDGNVELMKHDVNTAMYWYMIQHAFDLGMQQMNFEGSFAWVTDGVFKYKRRWGAEVHSDPGEHDQLLFRAQNLSAEWREHLNTIGFIACGGDKYLRIFIDRITPSIERPVEAAMKEGLDGIQVVAPGHSHSQVNQILQSSMN